MCIIVERLFVPEGVQLLLLAVYVPVGLAGVVFIF